MTKYKIEFDRLNCIGAGACVAVFPESWIMQSDGKPNLTGSGVNNKDYQEISVDISKQELEKHLLAARSCPVLVIHVTNLETGEKII